MATNILSLISVTLTGSSNGSSPVSAPGVKVGDVIISAYNTSDYINALQYGYFQPVVTTDDQIEQLGFSLAGQTFNIVLLRQ